MSPVQQATVEANGDAWCTEPDTYICNGPYCISEWVPSERIVLAKNPNYVGGWDSSKIVSDTITLLLLEDSSAPTPLTTAVRHSSSRMFPPMRSPA